MINFYALSDGDGKRLTDALWTSIWGKEVPHVGYLLAAFMGSSLHLLRSSLAHLHLRHTNLDVFGAASAGC